MIAVTGSAGFIGSCLIRFLNDQGIDSVIAVDDFSDEKKIANLQNKKISGLVHRNDFSNWLDNNHSRVGHIFHLGARTDTTDSDEEVFKLLNLEYSKSLWRKCTGYKIPLTYASSAATYGDGAYGYKDDHDIVRHLKPLNPYAVSKNTFDHWVLNQSKAPPQWHGLKFFNVYGPNEYHKGRMASVIFHAVNQIGETGEMKLFKSHKEGVEDGHQCRDFIYVKDVLKICCYCMRQNPPSGLYNVGTGNARTFVDLVKATFEALEKPLSISFIDTPEDIREKYQYYTQADISKLRISGYVANFTSLESGISDYVKKYLLLERHY